MKIKDMVTGQIIEGVVRDSAGNFLKNCIDHTRWYDKAYYTPVPDEKWVDVSAQCKAAEPGEDDANGSRIFYVHDGFYVGMVSNGAKHVYRIRKVCDCDPMPSVAFVIERKA